MTSPIFRPAPPVSPTWAPAGGWYTAGAQAAAPSTRSRMVATQGGPIMLPAGTTDDEARQFVAAYDQYIAKLTQAWQESSGLQRKQIEEQIKDAQAARANEIRIAEMNRDSQKYGIDQRRQTELDQLYENRRQFDASHGLEMERLGIERGRYGLDVAKAYTDYASTPDRAFMFADFNDAMGRVGQGLNPAPYGSQGQPQAKTWEDFAALAGFGDMPAVQAGQSGQMTATAGGGMPQPGAGSDPRIKAATGILKAMPPSDGVGHDDDNYAALDAIESVFRMSKPGSYERMRPGQQKMFSAGLSRRGYYAPDALKQMRRNAPNPGY